MRERLGNISRRKHDGYFLCCGTGGRENEKRDPEKREKNKESLRKKWGEEEEKNM